MIEFIRFKPEIFRILELPTAEARKVLQEKYDLMMGSPENSILESEDPIDNWKTFFEAKGEVTYDLKDQLSSNDKLRLYCVIRIFLRALVLLAWYSVIIMYADILSGEEILYYIRDERYTRFLGYLYKGFSLFLSVSSISVLTSTFGGTLLLLGQILIYFAVLIVVIGRITDSLTMFSNQVDELVHQSLVKRLVL